ncbi:kinase-like domain-containing protein [Trichophaea hybrida]|nr:kinase-like domain-containing protein [Trichophaea hybrida]
MATPSNGTPSASALVPVGGEVADINQETRDKYVKDDKIGEGTYAVVYRAHIKSTGQPVAIKKIKISSQAEGISMDSLREIKHLQELHHENIVNLLDVFVGRSQNINAVLEFLAGDLEGVIKDNTCIYGSSDIKSWMAMSLRGLWWCHRNFVLHRDIKPNNLLYTTGGILKIADFGFARSFADPGSTNMSTQVVTRWYRAPELLFGAKSYSSAIDVYALGVVFAELILRVPYLAGETDVNQLVVIANALGTPTEQNWPGVTSLPGYVIPNPENQLPEVDLVNLKRQFSSVSTSGVELLHGMIRLDPKKRLTSRKALESEWFREEPLPTKPQDLPGRKGKEEVEKVGMDLKRRAGWDEMLDAGEMDRGKKVARRLNFGA